MNTGLPDFAAWEAAADGLGLARQSGELSGPCPSCGGHDRFHVRRRGTAALVGCRGCCDGRGASERGEAFGAILRAAGFSRDANGAARTRENGLHAIPEGEKLDTDGHGPHFAAEEKRRAAAWALWSVPGLAEHAGGSTPAADYLRQRLAWPPKGEGFPPVPPDVHGIARRDWPTHDRVPALPKDAADAVAFAYRDAAGKVRAVSAEALTCAGLPLPGARRWRRTVGVRAGAWFAPLPRPGAPVLACEGEADALAAALLYPKFEARGYGGTAGLAAAELPDGGRACVILPDGDAGGAKAAADLAARYPAARVLWRSGAGDPAADLAETVGERSAVILEAADLGDAAQAERQAWREVLGRMEAA